MKTEMGESLVYSWMRHVENCQIVQTNWKTSPSWHLARKAELENFMRKADSAFFTRDNKHVFKGTSSLEQLLRQGEIDALGIRFKDGGRTHLIAVDVAFHAGGLMYGQTKADTALAVARKCLRSAMCLAGYFPQGNSGEILFASPKVTPATLNLMLPAVELVDQMVYEEFPQFRVRLLVNEEFRDKVLKPVLALGDKVADTAELFLRAYQMLDMFDLK